MATPDIYWSMYKTYFGHDSLKGFQRFAGLPETEQLDAATVEDTLFPICRTPRPACLARSFSTPGAIEAFAPWLA